MIRQLMKLDPAWVWLPFVLLAGIFICALGGNFAFWNLVLAAAVIAADRQADPRLYAGLPVPVRPVLVERTLALLALLWLPLAVAGYFLVARRDSGVSVGSVVALGSAITLASVWIQTTRIQGRNGASWLPIIPFSIWIVYTGSWPLHSGLPDWGSRVFRETGHASVAITAFCWLFTGALLLRAFVAAPASFAVEDAVPSRAVSDRPRRSGRVYPSPRIVFSLTYLWFLYFLLAMLTGLVFDTTIVAGAFLVTSWSSNSRNVRWMSALPVPPGALVAVIALPALIATAGGYALGVRLSMARLPWLKAVLPPHVFQGLRGEILSVISLAAALMLFTLFCICDDCRWRRAMSGGRLLLFAAVVPCAVLFARQNYVAQWASRTLPASLPAAVAIALIPLALIYWAIHVMFRQLEFVDKPAPGDPA